MIARLVFAAALLSAFPAAAGQQTIPASAEGQIEFITPSGNIGCIYTPEGGTSVYEPVGGGPELSCSRVKPTYVTVTLGPKGPAELIENPGEQGCCSDAPKLEYGNVWKKGPFVCKSAQTGLTCTGAAGHGFSLSKAKTAAQ